MRIFDQLNSAVLNGIEDVMDRFEDRQFKCSEGVAGSVSHRFEIDGEVFSVTIQKLPSE